MGNRVYINRQGYGVARFRSGDVFLFDKDDLDLVRSHTWHNDSHGYAATCIQGSTVGFHRLLFPDAGSLEVDHINGNTLDNRRSNLRLCTHRENAYNQRRRRTNTSGYIGVSYASRRGCFEAYINQQGRKYFLGYFTDAEDAAAARDETARLRFGKYARLNFPKGEQNGS